MPDDDFAALEQMLDGGGDAEAEPEPELEPEPEPEPAPAPEPADAELPSGPLSSKEVKKGMKVRLIADPAMRGVVKKKAGKNAQIDFTDSGGEPNKWTPVENLEHAGAAESAPAEKAAAAAADEAQQAPEPEPEGGPLKPQEVVVGMAVRKCADASATGKILVRRGQRARVDFSSSGAWRATFPQSFER